MLPETFDGRRLRRAWWTTPLIMTVIVFACVATLSVVIANGSAGRYQEPDVESALLIAAAIAAFLGLCGMAMGSGYHRSAKMALTVGLGVNELPGSHPMTQRVHGLAAKLNLPPPSVALMRQANAYAIGSSPNDAAVVLGMPLVKHLSPDELDAVIGHELGHIVSGDMRRMQFAEGYQQMFVSMFSTFVDALVKGVAKTRSGAQLGQALGDLGRVTLFAVSEMAVKRTSRSREYFADAVGAVLTSPQAMQGALEKIHNLPRAAHRVEKRYQSLMFCGLGGGSVFGTHPTLAQRLVALDNGHHIDAVMRRADAGSRKREQDVADAPASPAFGGSQPGRYERPAAMRSAAPEPEELPFEPRDEMTAGLIDSLYHRLYLVSFGSFLTGFVGGMFVS